MNTVYKALLKKGVIAIFVSAFVGIVYASQWHNSVHLPRFIASNFFPVDSPPPDTASTIDTRTAPPEPVPVKPPNNAKQNDTGAAPVINPNLNNSSNPNAPNQNPVTPNLNNVTPPNSNNIIAPNTNVPANSNDNPNITNPSNQNTTNPNTANPVTTNPAAPVPTPSVQQLKSADSIKPKAQAPDTTPPLHYPIAKEGESPKSSFDFTDPLKKDVQLDSGLNTYTIKHKIGNSTVGDSETKSFKQYQDDQNKQWMQDYFKKRSEAQVATQKGGLLPKLNLNTGTPLDDLAKLVKIEPNGSATLIFSEDFSRVQNPTYSLNEQRNAQFKFDQKIQVSVLASIGDRIKMNFRYDTQASFEFENQKKLSYQGKEDDILQSIDVGDVAFPVSGTLITGSQSLFGVKTKLQFGKLDVSAIFAQEKSNSSSITLQGGAQTNNFKITCDNYDANRNYFLAQYFVNHYDQYNAQWPALSNIQITKVELWVTNLGASVTNTRTIAAFLDLGEGQPYNNTFLRSNNMNPAALPSNSSNTLYATLKGDTAQYRVANNISNFLNAKGGLNYVSTRDYYVLQNARELQPNEFTLNSKLGYICLNQQLNPSDVLAVAFQYTIDGKTYQVGEFAEDVPPNPTTPNVLFLKMLKSVVIDSHIPDWKLMMKNIYSLGTYQISPTNFHFQVVYDNTKTGANLNYLPEPEIPGLDGTPIIRLLGMDKVNSENEPKPDGQFDYIEGVTVNSAQGKIIFPVLEPFGSDMKKLFGNDTSVASTYVYQLLYDSTHTFAVQDQTHNRYFLEGSFQGTAGNVISLNSINVPQGSVKVTANGVPLIEGADYTVDYNLGRVTIINQSVLNSGAVINVTSESNSLFSIQEKTLMGTHLDYHFNKKFTMGGTFLYLNERPLTTKVNIGEEPVNNAIWGFDAHYNSDSKFLTDMVNKIPLISTKEKSNITAEGEFADIIPGHPQVLNQPGQPGGVSYIDDFEGSIVPYDLRLGGNWTMASCPQGQPTRFPEGNLVNNLSYGYHRAKAAWYVIDNTMFENISGTTPPNIIGNNAILSDPLERMVQETEVFPNEQIAAGTPDICQTFDIYYNPSVRGPYNYTTTGVNAGGTFTNPSENWGGLQRSLPITDFLDANIQYVELWMMNPYTNPSIAIPTVGSGTMEIDLGTISEDVLHDDRESWENGLTCDGSAEDVTEWGRVPNSLHITTAFDIDPSTRPCQDVGYDGLSDDSERVRFAPFLNAEKNKLTAAAFNNLNNDPSGDNFHFWRGTDYDAENLNVVQREIQMNGVEGNTPISVGGDNGYGSLNPDDEDINHDFNVETSESYYEYEMKIDEPDLQVGRGYVTDEQATVVTLPNGSQQTAKWIQFKIPIEQFTRAVGSIQDFTSIRFMRIYLTGFSEPTVLRFARLQLVRGDWRKYLYSLDMPGDPLPTDTAQVNLDVSAISIETDGQRPGIRYVIPPGIQRQVDYSTPSLIQENEQSLDLKICGLKDGESRAVYKNVTLDLRQYKTLEMFAHCEANASNLVSGDLHLFIRMGIDYTANYYELDMPLVVTPRTGSGNVDLTWPTQNQIQLAVQQWVDMKTNRNLANGSLTVPYVVGAVGTAGELTVLGNPDLGDIRTIMIGLRHPKGDDKGPTPCAEVWVDELRMGGFNEKGGWAATSRVMAKLADFGRVELSSSYQTIGFGSIDQSLQQRNIQDMLNIGVISSFNLDKFFPKNYGLRIPMFFSYSQQLNTPEYNPLSPDQQLTTLTTLYRDNPLKQDSVIQACEDFTARKSLNFTGVHKERTGGTGKKMHIYDIENFNATYIYSEIDRHNITSIYNNEITYSGQLTYKYDFKPKSIDPFKKLGSKYLKILHDMNFYYLPQNFTMLAKIDRDIQEQLYRNTADYQTINTPMYDKTFTFTRKYDLRYNVSNGLRFTYSATALSLINEPDGLIDSAYKRQVIWNNIIHGGVPSNFLQSTALDYDVPISKLPFLDWTTLHGNYTANYQWTAAPPIAENLGNVVQNSQVITANGTLNFLKLYQTSKYLRNIISGVGNTKEEKTDKKDSANKKGLPNAFEKNKLPPKAEVAAPPVSHLTTQETLIGLLMSVRSATFSYTLSNGTALPGFLPTPQHFGEDFADQAPGFPFVFGSQTDIRQKAAQNGWITNDTNLSQQYITNHRESLVGTASLEPIKDLKIKVEFNRTQTSTFTETYRYIDTVGTNGGVYSGFAHLSPVETGNFSISIISLSSAFKPDGSNNSNVVFNKFLNDRLPVAQALARATPSEPKGVDSAGFPIGYSRTHQDVLIPAFLQAYAGMKVGTNEFPQIPAPNWSLTYTGLSSYPAFRAIAKQITLTSSYHSTYSVSSYTSNLYYNPSKPTFDTTYSNSTNFNSKYLIQGVNINEAFDPIIGVDVTLKSNWTGTLAVGEDRQESLTFIDQRITENKTTKITLGMGYITNRLYLPFTRGRSKRYLKNEFKFRLDVQINQNEQEVRILDQESGDATGGQLMIAILPNITYTLNKNLTLNIFLKRDMTTPYTSMQFPTSLTSIGFSIKYVLTP